MSTTFQVFIAYSSAAMHCLLCKTSQSDLDSEELGSIARGGGGGETEMGTLLLPACFTVVMRIKWDTRLEENVPVAPDTS